MSTENKLKHLEFIQKVINRMARNSFLIKGWSVALITAVFTFSIQNSNNTFVQVACFPVILFWGLDGYYLYLEKKFRNLYDVVRIKREQDIDFSMNAKDDKSIFRWLKATFSQALCFFYLGLIASIIILNLLIN